MESSGNKLYSIPDYVCIAEKEIYLNLYEEHPSSVACLIITLTKFYLQSLASLEVKPNLMDIPIKSCLKFIGDPF